MVGTSLPFSAAKIRRNDVTRSAVILAGVLFYRSRSRSIARADPNGALAGMQAQPGTSSGRPRVVQSHEHLLPAGTANDGGNRIEAAPGSYRVTVPPKRFADARPTCVGLSVVRISAVTLKLASGRET